MKTSSKYQLSMAAILAISLAAAVSPIAAKAQSSDQVALITVSSFEEIAKDVNFVAQLIDKPEVSQQFAMMSFMVAQSLDKSKPVGIAVFAEGEDLGVLAMVPVTNTDQILQLLKTLEIPIQEGDDGVMEVTVQGQTVFAKAQNGWILVAQKPEQLATAPADPGKLISSLADTYDIGARIYVQNIPADLRAKAINGLKEGIESGLAREENESDAQYELRKSITLKQIDGFEQALQEMDELTIGWSLDSAEVKTYFDFIFTAVPGSKLAQQTAAYAEAKTDFAGFYQPDAAAMLSFSSSMAKEEIDQAMEVLSGLRTQLMNQIENEADLPDEKAEEVVKSAVGDIYDAFVDTIKHGKVDGGAVLLLAPDAMTLVAGGLCTAPEKVTAGLKKLEALAEDEPDFPGIQWDADNHGGLSFHTMQIPIPSDDEDAKKAKVLFGDELEVAIGTGNQNLFLAIGRDAVTHCKKIIDTSKENPGKAIAPMELSISLGQIMTTIAAIEADPVVVKIAEELKSKATDQDHVRITATVIGNGIQYRILAEEGILQAIGTAVKMQAGN